MSDIVEAVSRAIKDALHSQDIYTREGVDCFKVDGFVDVEQAARAAVEAYEAAKMRDLLSGLLVQKVASDGHIEHVDREAMMNTWEGRKR